MADGPSFLYKKLVQESWYKKFARVSSSRASFSRARNLDELEQCSILYEKLGCNLYTNFLYQVSRTRNFTKFLIRETWTICHQLYTIQSIHRYTCTSMQNSSNIKLNVGPFKSTCDYAAFVHCY